MFRTAVHAVIWALAISLLSGQSCFFASPPPAGGGGGGGGGADSTAPTVTAVSVHDGSSVDVTFDESMGEGVTTPANYTLSGTGKGTLAEHPDSAALLEGNTYRLTWTSGMMLGGGDVTIAVTDVADEAGNTIAESNSGTHAGGAMATAPTVSAVAAVDGLNVDVAFSHEMGSSVLTVANYTLSGGGKGTLADHPASVALVSANTYRLTWTGGVMLDGGDITVTVAGVADAAGNAIGTPDSGTDSGGAMAEAPTVTAVEVVNGLNVDVTFSRAMGEGAITAANYALTGTGKGTLGDNPASVALVDGSTYRLTWSTGTMLNEGDITITVTGVADAAGNAIGTPNSGTASAAAIATPPMVTAVAVHDGLNVDVTFSKVMGDGVTTAANYTLSGTGKGTLAAKPDSAALLSGNTYRLTWASGLMFNGGDIAVTVANVEDAAGNAIGTPNSGTHTGGAVAAAPTVNAVQVQDGLNVDVTFSRAMGADATTAANYTLSGSGAGDLAANPDGVALVAGSTYRLTWAGGLMLNGGDITITVANVPDPAGNALGMPASGTDTGGAVATVPTVTGVAVVDGLNVDVTFSRAMGNGVTTAAGYTLSGTGKGTLANHPDGVALVAGSTYRLTWNSGLMFNGGDITVTVAGVEDTVGNAIGAPNSGADAGHAVAAAPTVTGVAVVDGLNVAVTFSQAMGAAAEVATHYTLSGSGQGSLANNPDSVALVNGTTYRLTWAGGIMFNGGDITITVAGVDDAAGNALGAPDNGTDTGHAVAAAPTVTAVQVHSGLSVDVTFSQAMGNGVTTAANYALSGSGAGNLTANPNSVALVAGTTCRLTWNAGLMFNDGDITITVTGVTDAGGNAIGAPNSGTHTGGAIAAAPTVSAVTVFDALNVDVTFSQAMGNGATTAANYALSGAGQGSLAANPDSVALVTGNIYRLTWNAGLMVDGQDITITVTGLADAGGNAIGAPNSGTDDNGGMATGPTVTGVAVVDGLNVDVTFSRAMGAGVTTAANYALSGSGQGNLAATPDSVALQAGTTYRLTWNGGLMLDSGDITITVTGVQDSVGNAIGVSNSGTDTGGAVATGPSVSDVAVVDGLNVDVTFDRAMGAGVTTPASYTVSGSGKGSLAANPTSVAWTAGTTYRLTWASGIMLNGGDITITVGAAVEDSVGNVMGAPNSGTDAGHAVAADPTVTDVAVQSALTVDVTFSQAMGASATVAAHYTVSGSGQGNLTANPDSVALVSGSTYRLTWNAGLMVNGGDITVTVAGVLDAAGNALGAPNSGTDAAGAICAAPSIITVAVPSALHVDVTYSQAMGAGVTTAANYMISGAGKGDLNVNPDSVALQAGNTYRLTWNAGLMVDGGDVTIIATGVADAVGNTPGGPIFGTGTGAAIATHPTVSAVAVVDGLNVDVTFDRAMGAGVTTAANYTLSGSGQGSLSAHPDGVALSAGNTYRLTWNAGLMFNGGDITITVGTGAKDTVGNAVGAPNSGTDGGHATATTPTVTGVAVVDGLSVDVTFDKAMGNGVTTPANYTLSDTGQGSLSAHPDNVALSAGTTYRLTWNTGVMHNGGDITITVDNSVADAGGNTLDPAHDAGTDAGAATAAALSVSSVAVVDGLNVDVTFSAAMGNGVTAAANYTLTGNGKGTLAGNPNSVALVSGSTYRLTWNAGLMFNGGDITITVAAVEDAGDNAIGAGDHATDVGGAVASALVVSSVVVHDALNVDVTFSQAMGGDVTTAADYTVSGTGQGTLTANPDSVAIVAGNTYRLTWNAGLMFIGGDITITVTGVHDAANNPISVAGTDNVGTDTGGATGTDLAVSAVQVITGLSVEVTFNHAMGADVTTAGAYTVSGSGKGTLADNPDNVALQAGNTYRLTWNSGVMLIGGDITITVAGVHDVANNPLGADDSDIDAGGATATVLAVGDVTVVGGVTVDVAFNQPMNDAEATTAANFTLSGTGQGTLASSPNSVVLQDAATNKYRLTWDSGMMHNGGDITITAANVHDEAGNALGATDSDTDAGAAVATLPTVTGVAVQNETKVRVTFDRTMSGAALTMAANYTVGGSGQGSYANNPAGVAQIDDTTVELTWANTTYMFNGGDITITVANAADLAGNVVDGAHNSAMHAGGAIARAPTVVSVIRLDATHIGVTFSKRMDAATAADAANYSVTGGGNLGPAALQGVGASVKITTDADPFGELLTITVNVTDSGGNPLAAEVVAPI